MVLQKNHRISDFFVPVDIPKKRGRGRPKKAKSNAGRRRGHAHTPVQVLIGSLKGVTATTKKQKPQVGAQRRFYGSTSEFGKKMQEIVYEYSVNGAMYKSIRKFSMKMALEVFDDAAVAETIRKRLGQHRKNKRQALGDAREDCALLKAGARDGLAETLALSDEKSKGMNWPALIDLVKKAEPSLDGRSCETAALSVLRTGRKGGILKKSNVRTHIQTSRRCEAGSAQNQLEWHKIKGAAIDALLEQHKQAELPGSTPLHDDVFDARAAHFIWNGDETCFMLGSDNKLHVVYGSSRRKKHELLTCDVRLSITLFRCGNSAGTQGPFIAVMKCKKIPELWTPAFMEQLGAPPGSCCIATENAFMTDIAWLELTKSLAPGMRQSDAVMQAHPELNALMSLDGFGSHTNSSAACAHFKEHSIGLLLESGNASQLAQAYDQDVAKKDKSNEKDVTGCLVRNGVAMPDQWDLLTAILACCTGVEYERAWKSSFKKVNFVVRPVPWLTWKEKPRIKESIAQAEANFVAARPNEHAARTLAKLPLLPKVWTNLPVAVRQRAVLYAQAHSYKSHEALSALRNILGWGLTDMASAIYICLALNLSSAPMFLTVMKTAVCS